MSTGAKLIIDLGNSETRIQVIHSSLEGGKLITHFSNRYANLPEGYTLAESYFKDTQILSVGAKVWAHGGVVDNEFSMTAIRPTALSKKYTSEISEVTIRLALFFATQSIAEAQGIDMEDVKVRWAVTVLLPPNDIEVGRDIFKDKVKAITNIIMAYPDMNLHITVSTVNVVPEGFAAYIGAFFKDPGHFRDGYKKYVADSVLVVDIGAGTTDFCVVNAGKIVENSKDTIEIGGTNVQQRVNQSLRSNPDYGTFPEQTVREVAETGILRVGARKLDLSEVVHKAHEEVAEELVKQITAYFETVSYPVNNIAYVLVCGGGSINSDKVESISVPIVKYLKGLAKFAELIPSVSDVSPRDLNIIGAGIIAEK